MAASEEAACDFHKVSDFAMPETGTKQDTFLCFIICADL